MRPCAHDRGKFVGLSDEDGRNYLWCCICGALGFADPEGNTPVWLSPQHARGFPPRLCGCGTCDA